MKLNYKQIKAIVYSYDLDDILSQDLDTQDNEINEIILECLSRENAEPFTSEWDKLYKKYEELVYKAIKSKK